MAIDRSKFRKTSVAQLQAEDKELNKALGKKERNNSNGHDLEDGANLFRIYPAHPDGDSSNFAQPFAQTFVPAMVAEKDKDGNTIWINKEKKEAKLKLGVKPVWNAKVHGGKPKDLIEEFINLAGRIAKENNMSEDQRKEFVKPIYGAFSKDKSKNIQGINYASAWVLYADKYPNANPAATPVFDEWRIKKGIKDRLNKISAVETSGDALGTDPFTDLEEGKAVKVFKDPEAQNPANYYTTELDNSSIKEVINGRTLNVQKTYPLSDVQLEAFMAKEPLCVKYGAKLATRKNFEAQLNGLQLLDDKYRMGIFDHAEWGNLVAEMDEYYPEVDPVDPVTNAANTDTDVVEEDVVDDGDQFELMSRAELQAFAKENKTGILVRPGLTDDQLRDKLRIWEASSTIEHVPLPGEEGYVEEKVEAEVVSAPVVETPVTPISSETKQSPADKLAAMRAKMKNTKAA